MVRVLQLCILIGWLVGFASCEDQSKAPGALLNLVLVDAPPAFDSVFIEILGVDARVLIADSEQSFFIPYDLGDKQIKISDLVGGNVLLLGREVLPAGQLIGLDLRLGNNHQLWEDETAYPIPLASGRDPFVSIQASETLESGLSYDLILDFDLQRSIQTVSQTPLGLELTPTVQLIRPGEMGQLQGSIQGNFRPAFYAIREGDSLSTQTNSSGSFLFRLAPGRYSLYADPKNENFLPVILPDLEIIAGQTSILDPLTFSPKP